MALAYAAVDPLPHELSSVTRSIGPDGGVLEIPGRVLATIPAGALRVPVELTVEAVGLPSMEVRPFQRIIQPAYRFRPMLVLEKPAEIRLHYLKQWLSSDADEGSLAIGLLLTFGNTEASRRPSIEASETGEEFAESSGQGLDTDAQYVSVRTRQWGGTRMLLYQVFTTAPRR